MPKRVVIVDNHPVVLFGLSGLLNGEPDLEVVGEATCCESGCRSIEELQPDVVLFDLDLGGISGEEVVTHFRSRFADLPAIVYTNEQDRQVVADTLKNNVQGYVLKTSPVDHLVQAIRFVATGQSYIDPGVTGAVLAELSGESDQPEKPKLSNRELTVLHMLAEGKPNKEIARELFISERTVKFHTSSIFRRLDARNRTHAVRIAEELGLMSTPPCHREPPKHRERSAGKRSPTQGRWPNSERRASSDRRSPRNRKGPPPGQQERRSGADRRRARGRGRASLNA